MIEETFSSLAQEPTLVPAARVAALLRRGEAAAAAEDGDADGDGDADEDLLDEVMAEPMQWFATQELAPLLVDQDGSQGPSSVVG